MPTQLARLLFLLTYSMRLEACTSITGGFSPRYGHTQPAAWKAVPRTKTNID